MNNLLRIFNVVLLSLLAGMVTAQTTISLQPFANGFNKAVDIKPQDSRLFVVEKDGRIKIVTGPNTVLSTPFLDIDSRVNSSANERGLLGLAFHPDYANNGYFYLNYNDSQGDTRISRFSVSANDPNIADPNSELILMDIDQPYSNHNAGDLAFGPDGYLYIPLGDGGSGGDPQNISQNTNRLLGKMLRVDVDNGTPYSIPSDNPFVGNSSYKPEIWAVGLRNPWRISFDRLTGDLWIADVGQDDWEEIDVQPANSTGGENYGWRCYEGLDPFNTSGCGPASQYTDPIHQYANQFSIGCSVTGGYVYRGQDYPNLYGKYVYCDFCTGNFWYLEPDGQGGYSNFSLGNFGSQNFSAFGESTSGELFVAGIGDGTIYQIQETSRQVTCNLSAILEGAYDMTAGNMEITLNQAGIIPAEQPYNHPDWNYQGIETISNPPPQNMVDWVLVSFRETLNGGSVVRKAAVLNRNGTIEPFDVSLLSGLNSVYIMIEHRNHLPVMTDQPVMINNGMLTHNFTLNQGYIGAGHAQKQLGNKWVLFAGNGNQDELTGYDINAVDRAYWQPINGTFNIYSPADFNMDNDVSGDDRILWSYNNGIFSAIPKINY